jgi:hypothetical protein
MKVAKPEEGKYLFYKPQIVILSRGKCGRIYAEERYNIIVPNMQTHCVTYVHIIGHPWLRDQHETGICGGQVSVPLLRFSAASHSSNVSPIFIN